MAVQPNTTGYLSRGTNVPANGTGWTKAVWFRATATPSNYPALFELDASNDDWADVSIPPGTLDLGIEMQGASVGFAYVLQPILTLTAGVWYFFAMRVTGTGANNATILYRASSSGSLTTVGPFTCPDVAWSQMWLLNDRFGGVFVDGQARAAKLWHAALSDVEILAESFQEPPARTSGIDSYLSLLDATDAGDDESGNGRDWTVTGTLATVGSSSSIAATLAGLTAAASLQANKPVTIGAGLAGLTAAASLAANKPITIAGGLAGLVSSLQMEADGGGGGPGPAYVRRPRDRMRGREMRWRG